MYRHAQTIFHDEGHKLLDETDFSTTRLQAFLPSFMTEKCRVHKANVLEMNCKNHDEILCPTCVALNHRTCKGIHSIPDEVDNLYKQSASAETIKKLAAVTEDVKNIKKYKERLLRELKHNSKKAIDSIRAFSKEMEAELKRLETEALREVEAEFKRIESGLKNEILEVEEYNTDLDQYANKLQTSTINKAQEFVCIKTSTKEIEKVKKSKQRLKHLTNVKISFSADLKIQNFLKKLKTLGQTKTLPAERSTLYAVKTETNIDIKLTDDKSECCIWDSCYITDGTLLLADFNNHKLKRMHISTHVIKDNLDLGARPISICQTSKQEAAVSLIGKTIQFVSLRDKMATTKELKLDHHCYGLAYNDGKLFISDKGHTVYIHDLTGTMLDKIKTDKSSNSIFSRSRHVCLSSKKDRVYVADSDKGLITLDTQGNYLSTFTDPDLTEPFGVCTDRGGNIFVCGYMSSNIVQINEKLQIKLDVLGKVRRPLSVCFDPNLKMLIVTSISNDVKVYELQ